MTPLQRQRIDALKSAGYTAHEHAVALLELLRELSADVPSLVDHVPEHTRVVAATGHAAAIVELLPLPAVDVGEDDEIADRAVDIRGPR